MIEGRAARRLSSARSWAIRPMRRKALSAWRYPGVNVLIEGSRAGADADGNRFKVIMEHAS